MRRPADFSAMLNCSNPGAQFRSHKDAIGKAINRVLDSGWYILGSEVTAFEIEFARYCGASHGIGVANGTEALALALMALGIGRGDEVITVSHTAVATVAAIEQAGAVPILVDVEPDRYTLDPTKLAEAMSPAVKAIIVVHLYGQPADMDAIRVFARERGLRVIEDCAQSHGALHGGSRVGSLGDLGCFSFFPTKNLGAIGDGGAIVTSDSRLAERLYQLREYGWKERFISAIAGINSRLDALQAAILRVKLPYLEIDNAARARIADTYRRELHDLPLLLSSPAAGTQHVYHQFVVRSERRDDLLAHLRRKGINAGVHYPRAVHQQPAYQQLPRRSSLDATEQLIPRILSLPIYPELDADEVGNVIEAVRSFFHA
jgi:dTDP-4-amino-4,6-dideoxygalactose transaminase